MVADREARAMDGMAERPRQWLLQVHALDREPVVDACGRGCAVLAVALPSCRVRDAV